MPHSHRLNSLVHFLTACALAIFATGATCCAWAVPNAAEQGLQPSPQIKAVTKHRIDRSGHKRVGKASFYARKFAGKKMADGTKMDPHDDNAASKTLPLGTTAKVTNLENGKSAVVTIQDRGPYVKGRIVDLSSSTAQKIGIGPDNGTANVEVVPISIPPTEKPVEFDNAPQESK